MLITGLVRAFLIPFFLSAFSFAGCISFNDAPKHIGESHCVNGKILSVAAASSGYTRLSFCREGMQCPLTAVVPNDDSVDINDLRGKSVTIKGLLVEFNGNAQIILKDRVRLSSEDVNVPSMMTAYDVDEPGHYSPGTSRAGKAKRVSTKKQPATLPIAIPEDSEEAGPASR